MHFTEPSRDLKINDQLILNLRLCIFSIGILLQTYKNPEISKNTNKHLLSFSLLLS